MGGCVSKEPSAVAAEATARPPQPRPAPPALPVPAPAADGTALIARDPSGCKAYDEQQHQRQQQEPQQEGQQQKQQQRQAEQEAGAAAAALGLLNEVYALQQKLALLSSACPLLGLPDAAGILAAHPGTADLVGIFVEGPGCSVLVAAHGAGADALERHCAVLPAAPGDPAPRVGAVCSFVVADAAAAAGAGADGALPRGVPELFAEAGLRSFAHAPIGPEGAPLGSLLFARKEPLAHAGAEGSWRIWLHAAATGLLQYVHHPQTQQAAALAAAIRTTPTPLGAVASMLRAARRFVHQASGVKLSARLALLIGEGSDEALLFELPSSAPSSWTACAPTSGSAPARPVNVSSMAVDGATLLSSALRQQRGVFVRDCSSYMQNSRAVARDVFTHGADDAVGSLALVPFAAAGRPAGAVYFVSTDAAVASFESLRDVLMGFVSSATRGLLARLEGELGALVDQAAECKLQSMSSSLAGSVLSGSAALPPNGLAGPDAGPDASMSTLQLPLSAAAGAASAGGAAAATGCSGSSCDGSDVGPAAVEKGRRARRSSLILLRSGSRPRMNSECMLQVMQREVRKSWRRNSGMADFGDLVVTERIGRGGFGTVYRGTWHKAPAAVKIMDSRGNELQLIKDATEMAVLSALAHPCIVTLYACLTDMVEVEAGSSADWGWGGSSAAAGDSFASGASAGGPAAPGATARYRRLLPGEDPPEGVSPCNILVMEYCDRGTLRGAVKGGAFHTPLPGGAVGVDAAAVVGVLLDVAAALQYIHSMQLVHGDIKLDNIMLKTDSTRPLGFAVKLGDFGLAKILMAGSDHAVNVDGAGTVTHLAPEMFQAGSKVTQAVDAYAFGIFMYELYTGLRAYAGLQSKAVAERVFRNGQRPQFPAGAPRSYADLAQDCWRTEPAARPAAAEIVRRLEAVMAELSGTAPPAAPPPAALPPALAAALTAATPAASPPPLLAVTPAAALAALAAQPPPAGTAAVAASPAATPPAKAESASLPPRPRASAGGALSSPQAFAPPRRPAQPPGAGAAAVGARAPPLPELLYPPMALEGVRPLALAGVP